MHRRTAVARFEAHDYPGKMQHADTWVLVADASRAFLFRSGADGIVLKQKFDHPESRGRAADLVSDSNGEKPVGARPGHGPGAAAQTDPKRVEAERFAHDLANHLRVHVEHDPTPLVVVAAPQFLGMLRNTMTDQVAKRVIRSINEDLTNVPTAQLMERLASELPH